MNVPPPQRLQTADRFTQPVLSPQDHALVGLLLKHQVTTVIPAKPFVFQPDAIHRIIKDIQDGFYRYFPKLYRKISNLIEPLARIKLRYHKLFPYGQIRIERWFVRPGDFVIAGSTPLFEFRFLKLFGLWPCRDRHTHKADTDGILERCWVDDRGKAKEGKPLYSVVPLPVFEVTKGNLKPEEIATRLRYSELTSIIVVLTERLTSTTVLKDEETDALTSLYSTLNSLLYAAGIQVDADFSNLRNTESIARRVSEIEQDPTLSAKAKEIMIGALLNELDDEATAKERR